MHAEDRSLLIRVALIILMGLVVVLVAGQCSRPAYAAQTVAGSIEYTADDDYPALCAGRELDIHGRPVVARIGLVDGVVRIKATSCGYIFGSSFE
jgi:hypothetical protein